MHSTLASLGPAGVTFNMASIMRRAHHEGRFALRMCRTVAQRRAQLSRWLKLAWMPAATLPAKQPEERTMLARTMSAAAFSPCSQPLPVQEAMNLYAALETIFDVIAGLRCQPRFARDDAEAGKAQAGDELDEMTNAIADRMGALVDEIRAARPADPFLQRRRAEFLLRHAIGDEPRVSDIATAAVRAVFQDRF